MKSHAFFPIVSARHHGNIGPDLEFRFPKQLAPRLELKRAAIGDSLSLIESPDSAPQDMRNEPERSVPEDQVKVQASTRPQWTTRLDEGAASTEIHNVNHATRSQRRLRHVLG